MNEPLLTDCGFPFRSRRMSIRCLGVAGAVLLIATACLPLMDAVHTAALQSLVLVACGFALLALKGHYGRSRLAPWSHRLGVGSLRAMAATALGALALYILLHLLFIDTHPLLPAPVEQGGWIGLLQKLFF